MSESEKEGKPSADDLLEEQEGKGYGEDEGERDDAFERDGADES